MEPWLQRSEEETSELSGSHGERTNCEMGSLSAASADCSIHLKCICETPDTVQSAIDVFVKRLSATKGRHESAPNVWCIQGDPGLSSVGCTLFLEPL
ncbi:hypothetical protein GQ600_1554 [Phytophthora cactorum]|nr:hypothetical protein GQ600_1554 [Phytophthora cactorum]